MRGKALAQLPAPLEFAAAIAFITATPSPSPWSVPLVASVEGGKAKVSVLKEAGSHRVADACAVMLGGAVFFVRFPGGQMFRFVATPQPNPAVENDALQALLARAFHRER